MVTIEIPEWLDWIEKAEEADTVHCESLVEEGLLEKIDCDYKHCSTTCCSEPVSVRLKSGDIISVCKSQVNALYLLDVATEVQSDRWVDLDTYLTANRYLVHQYWQRRQAR